jgi:diguanylate cyclase (GGDEF)-like protein
VHIAKEALAEPGAMITLFAIDVDRFKGVNDTFGHHVGDEMLRAIAVRLQSFMRQGDMVARTGGDEFTCLLRGPVSRSDALKRAWVLHAGLSEPMELQGMRLNTAASVGVAVSPGDGKEFEGLLRSANWAMRAAKRSQSRVELHTRRLDDKDSWRMLLLNEFRDAIRRGELVLHYQPKVHLASKQVIGVEALVRWQHPQHGLLQPDAFLAAVEQTELIRDMTEYVLQRAVGQCMAWRADGMMLTVAVNLSTRSIPDLKLVESVQHCLKKYGLPAHALELEITESSAMSDPVHGLKTLHALEKLGVLLSVDDYGTGHGSLDYLRKLPVKLLKLDRSFVADIHSNKTDAAIVRSTLELARHLHLDVVAEGVEDLEACEALTRLGCFAAQGYYFSRPVPAEQVMAVAADIETRLMANS